MDLRAYLRAIRKSWWIVLITTVLGLGITSALTLRSPSQYQSTVTFFVNTASDSIAGSVQGDSFAQRRVTTYSKLLKTDQLAEMVASDLNIGMTPAQISATISARVDASTVLLTATITDTSPSRALQLAGSISVQFVGMVGALEKPDSQTTGAARLEVVDGPTVDLTPVAPQRLQNLLVGLLAGLALGLLCALLRDAFSTAVRSTRDLQESIGVGALGVIPRDRGNLKHKLINGDSHRTSAWAESIRQLRTSLQFLDTPDQVRVIAVTASVHDEGASITAANLAIAFADVGSRVLLVDADLRNPQIADLLRLNDETGLAQVLAGKSELSTALQPSAVANLTVLTAGAAPRNPSELLASNAMGTVMASVRRLYDIIIVDTPPLLPLTDAAIVTTWADGAIVVIRHRRTRRAQLASAARVLGSVDARVLGSVPNMVTSGETDSYGYFGEIVREEVVTETTVGHPVRGYSGPADRTAQFAPAGIPEQHLNNGLPKQPINIAP